MAQLTKFGVPGGTSPVLQPKLGYRFRVKFLFGGGLLGVGALTSQVVSCGRPTLTTENTVLDVYNSKIKIAGKSTWGDIQLVVRDDVNNTVANIIAIQLGRQMDHAGQSSALAGANYKFQMLIQTLDGGNDNVQVIDTWSINGAFLASVAYGDMDYGSNEAVKITMSIMYDAADYHVGDVLTADLPGQLSEAGGGVGLAVRSSSPGLSATS